MPQSRRDVLSALIRSSLALGMRSMVTGIPPAVWLNPERALAAEPDSSAVAPKFVIYSMNTAGEPINCNAPGCYDDPLNSHAQDPSMAATSIVQRGESRLGAQVWTGLPQAMLDKTVFFHHATYTIIHTETMNVMRLQGAVDRGNMLPCALAKTLGARLGTVQAKPMCLYSDLGAALIDEGIPQAMHPPQSMQNIMGAPQGDLGSAAVMQMRDKSLDALNAWAKKRGKPFQRNFIDKYALSRTESRTVQQQLGKALTNIKDNSSTSQINLAIALFKLKIMPVAAVGIGFGGDNHKDEGLMNFEVPEHKKGVATLSAMYKAIDAAGLKDNVSFLLTNVFGRTASKTGNTANGRGHNDGHTVSILYGPNINGGVVGGMTQPANANDFRALPINAQSGRGDMGGNIGYRDTLASMGKTFTASVGGETGGVSFRAGTIIPSIYT